MTDASFDRSSWERRWAQALRQSPETLASRPPNAHLLAEVADLPPGLDYGRSTALAVGPDVAGRIEWAEGDLGSWAPAPRRFDLVSCLYVHVAGSVVEMVGRLGGGVAPGGMLLMVGHRPTDPATGAAAPAAGQVQVSVGEAVQALDPHDWQLVVAEERPRRAVGSGVDAVVRAVRRS